MARDRTRQKPDERRRPPASPDAAPDPIGRLDEVLATLEGMLDGRGVPSTARSPDAEGTPGPAAGIESGETLPVLQDVVAPAVNGRANTERAEPELPLERGPDPAASPEREPLPLGFEFVPDEPVPPIGALDLEDPDAGPGGERYGDAPPPSLAPEVYRHLIDRLANEIDVIVQTGTEEAMQRAAVDIAARVREHVAIILPEVIEELVRMSARPPD